MSKLSQTGLIFVLAGATLFAIAVVNTALGNVDEVDEAYHYISRIIEKASLVPFESQQFFANEGRKFSINEAKTMCGLAAKHMYMLERNRAEEENETVTIKDAFINILGAYSTCTMAVGWFPDLRSVKENWEKEGS